MDRPGPNVRLVEYHSTLESSPQILDSVHNLSRFLSAKTLTTPDMDLDD